MHFRVLYNIITLHRTIKFCTAVRRTANDNKAQKKTLLYSRAFTRVHEVIYCHGLHIHTLTGLTQHISTHSFAVALKLNDHKRIIIFLISNVCYGHNGQMGMGAHTPHTLEIHAQ